MAEFKALVASYDTPLFMNYITWALIGMVGHSFTTFLVKFATRNGQFSSFLVLDIACIITLTARVVDHDCPGRPAKFEREGFREFERMVCLCYWDCSHCGGVFEKKPAQVGERPAPAV